MPTARFDAVPENRGHGGVAGVLGNIIQVGGQERVVDRLEGRDVPLLVSKQGQLYAGRVAKQGQISCVRVSV